MKGCVRILSENLIVRAMGPEVQALFRDDLQGIE